MNFVVYFILIQHFKFNFNSIVIWMSSSLTMVYLWKVNQQLVVQWYLPSKLNWKQPAYLNVPSHSHKPMASYQKENQVRVPASHWALSASTLHHQLILVSISASSFLYCCKLVNPIPGATWPWVDHVVVASDSNYLVFGPNVLKFQKICSRLRI